MNSFHSRSVFQPLIRQSQKSLTSLMSRKSCIFGRPLRVEKQHWINYCNNIIRLSGWNQHETSLMNTLHQKRTLSITPGATLTVCYGHILIQTKKGSSGSRNYIHYRQGPRILFGWPFLEFNNQGTVGSQRHKPRTRVGSQKQRPHWQINT